MQSGSNVKCGGHDGHHEMKKRGKHPVILQDVIIKNIHKEDKR